MVIPQTGGTSSRSCAPQSRLIDPFVENRAGTNATTTSATAKRVPAKVRSDRDEEDSSSSDDDDDVVAAYVSVFFVIVRL